MGGVVHVDVLEDDFRQVAGDTATQVDDVAYVGALIYSLA